MFARVLIRDYFDQKIQKSSLHQSARNQSHFLLRPRRFIFSLVAWPCAQSEDPKLTAFVPLPPLPTGKCCCCRADREFEAPLLPPADLVRSFFFLFLLSRAAFGKGWAAASNPLPWMCSSVLLPGPHLPCLKLRQRPSGRRAPYFIFFACARRFNCKRRSPSRCWLATCRPWPGAGKIQLQRDAMGTIPIVVVCVCLRGCTPRPPPF